MCTHFTVAEECAEEEELHAHWPQQHQGDRERYDTRVLGRAALDREVAAQVVHRRVRAWIAEIAHAVRGVEFRCCLGWDPVVDEGTTQVLG